MPPMRVVTATSVGHGLYRTNRDMYSLFSCTFRLAWSRSRYSPSIDVAVTIDTRALSALLFPESVTVKTLGDSSPLIGAVAQCHSQAEPAPKTA